MAKYEAVLEMDPQNRPTLRNCAFAMYDLGRLQPDPASRAARQLLEVGIAACYTCASKTGHIRLGCQHGITQQEEHIRTMGAES